MDWDILRQDVCLFCLILWPCSLRSLRLLPTFGSTRRRLWHVVACHFSDGEPLQWPLQSQRACWLQHEFAIFSQMHHRDAFAASSNCRNQLCLCWRWSDVPLGCDKEGFLKVVGTPWNVILWTFDVILICRAQWYVLNWKREKRTVPKAFRGPDTRQYGGRNVELEKLWHDFWRNDHRVDDDLPFLTWVLMLTAKRTWKNALETSCCVRTGGTSVLLEGC